jgi:hypothetical protein
MKDSEIIKKEINIAEHEKSSIEGENIQHTVAHGPGSGSVMRPQEIVSPVPSGPQQSYFQGDKRRNIPEIHRTDEENLNRNFSSGAQGPSSLGGNRQHPNLEAAFLPKDRLQDEASKQSFPPPRLHHMPDGYNSNLLGKDQTPETDRNGVEQGIHMGEISDRSADEGDDDLSEHDGFASTPPKYTITEKWILDYQKRKYEENEKKVLGQQKVHKRMAASYHKLKVSLCLCHIYSLEMGKASFRNIFCHIYEFFGSFCFIYSHLHCLQDSVFLIVVAVIVGYKILISCSSSRKMSVHLEILLRRQRASLN